jgi:regulatory protein
VGRELRRHRALTIALRSLRSRDRSTRQLERRLAAAAVSADARADAIATLERAGVLDDDRFAHGRAQTLATRGWGDAAIRADLERAGVAPERIEEALAQLEPEKARAEAIVACRRRSARTARYLAARGFEPELVAEIAAPAAIAAEG